MKRIRIIPLMVFFTASVAAASAPSGFRPEPRAISPQLQGTPRQLHAGEGGVLIADEYQVPVKEGVELPDSPATDADQGDAEAQLPGVEAVPPEAGPPPAEELPDTEQPPIE